LRDTSTRGVLPVDALECGSLLEDGYRVNELNQTPCGGLKASLCHTRQRSDSDNEFEPESQPYNNLKRVRIRLGGRSFRDGLIKFADN